MKQFLFTVCTLISGWVCAQNNLSTFTFGSPGVESNLETIINANDEIFMAGLYGSNMLFGNDSLSHKGGNADAYYAKINADGTSAWVKTFGGWADEAVSAFTQDAAGNSYLTGYFQGNDKAGKKPFDADPSETGEFFLNQPGNLLTRDCFIIKLDPNGDFVWAKQISNYEFGVNEDSFDIVVDAEGNVIVVGRFLIADFDPSEKDTLNIQSVSGKFEAFVLKLNSDGDLKWVKHFYGNEVVAKEIAIDADENLIVAGDFKGTVNLDSNTAMVNKSKRSYNMFLAKLSPSGDVLASRNFGGDANISITKMALKSNGDIMLGGRMTGICELNPTDSTDVYISRGGTDMFLNVFDSKLNYKFSRQFGGSGNEQIFSILEDIDGSILMSTNFGDSLVVSTTNNNITAKSNGDLDVLLLALDANGNYKSHLNFGGPEDEFYPIMNLKSNGEVVLSNSFRGTTNANPYGEIDSLTSEGLNDVYLIRFNWASVLTSIKDFAISPTPIIYPNPTKNVLNIKGINAMFYQLYTTQGLLISKGEIKVSGVDVSSLETGNYIISVSDANGMRYPMQFNKQ